MSDQETQAEERISAHPDMVTWKLLQKTNPAFVKPITGRPYKGTSPNPTYCAMKMTAKFGLCGHGWGYSVLSDKIIEGEAYPDRNASMLLHVIRISFWTKHPETGEVGHFESYGQTIMARMTNRGDYLMDEDAPKKSLTDAIIKAMSMIGMSADIFLGRYDDQKYVQSLYDEIGQDGGQQQQRRQDPRSSTGDPEDNARQPGPPPSGPGF